MMSSNESRAVTPDPVRGRCATSAGRLVELVVVTVSGGANRSVVGLTALQIEPVLEQPRVDGGGVDALVQLGAEQQTRHRGRTSPAGSLETSSVRRRALLARRAPVRRCGASRRRPRSTAAVAIAVPLYVLPWSPGWNTAATSRRAQHAPTGIPLPIALASVTTSGATSCCSKPNHVRCARSRSGSRRPSSALRPRRRARGSRAGSREAPGSRPPSPCSGSISTAATTAVDSGPHRVEVAPGDVPEALRHRLRTARAWPAGRWPRASPACARGSCRGR